MGLSGSAAEHPILAHNCAAWTTILTQGEGTRLPFRHPARRLKKLREQHQTVTRQEGLAVTLTVIPTRTLSFQTVPCENKLTHGAV